MGLALLGTNTSSKQAVIADLLNVSHRSCLQAREFGSGIQFAPFLPKVTVPILLNVIPWSDK